MQINDIISEMQPSDYSSVGNCCGNLGGCCGNLGGYGNAGIGNCGFGWWIWILLILFYTNQGTNNTGSCCCNNSSNDCCCCNSGNMSSGYGSCSSWLFLLVILFLCSGCNGGGCGCGYGNYGYGNAGIGDGLDGLVGGCY